MRLRVIKHLLTATVLLKSFAKLAVAALDHSGDVVKRYDYEPGDELNRTMCFCTSDPSLQQTDNDPFAFFNTTVDHHMMYVFEFAYYNHR